jgi:hypothetical protein
MKLTTPEVPGSNAEFQLVDERIFHRREQRAGLNLPKSKSAAFVWEFMFTRAMHRTNPRYRRGSEPV